ncbi:hypothetical protein CF319_g80 [Tilletia indica]|nr:hypothetical protein CF319_g80 [Tilletia indica]
MVGAVLADWGADVVRIDRVEDGTTFDMLCRGKRSVAINGKHAKGRQVIKDLIRNADVLLDPFRPGVLEKLGLGPQDLMEEHQGNKGLVYARQTGFQRTVPSAPESPHPRPQDQLKRTLWPDLRAYLTATFASRPRSFFESLFTGSDACAVPVLTRDEAAVRGSSPFANPEDVGVPADSSSSSQTEPGSGAANIVIPAVAPNLTRTPARIPHGSPGRGEDDRGAEMVIQAGEHTLEVIKEWKILGEGEGGDRLKGLWMEGVVGGPETPEGWEPARIMAKL